MKWGYFQHRWNTFKVVLDSWKEIMLFLGFFRLQTISAEMLCWQLMRVHCVCLWVYSCWVNLSYIFNFHIGPSNLFRFSHYLFWFSQLVSFLTLTEKIMEDLNKFEGPTWKLKILLRLALSEHTLGGQSIVYANNVNDPSLFTKSVY